MTGELRQLPLTNHFPLILVVLPPTLSIFLKASLTVPLICKQGNVRFLRKFIYFGASFSRRIRLAIVVIALFSACGKVKNK